MSFLRRVAGRSLRDRVRSSVTREELGVEPLLLRIERSQLRWLGHLFRMPPGRLPREVFQACPTGRRPRGRPRTRWRNYVSRLAWERLGVPPEELEEVSGSPLAKPPTTCLNHPLHLLSGLGLSGTRQRGLIMQAAVSTLRPGRCSVKHRCDGFSRGHMELILGLLRTENADSAGRCSAYLLTHADDIMTILVTSNQTPELRKRESEKEGGRAATRARETEKSERGGGRWRWWL
ncbi:hypothetical protein L3Q82_016059 [Scortum barcoo]|uniref:Uncharacterized protein n=1 Tax=Scortum barcoo TaxID=214431 RepID=A0ACB8VQ49_9TELE|nr:hypothetical protein L3Q82_016059 [Scortum barcoo]